MNGKESPNVDKGLKEDGDLEMEGPIDQCGLSAIAVEGASEKAKGITELTGGSGRDYARIMWGKVGMFPSNPLSIF